MEKPKKIKVKSSESNIKVSNKWTVIVTVLAFVITVIMTILTRSSEDIGSIAALCMLILIVAIGIVFDILGVAVSTASETPFNAMAARKINGARESIAIIRKAQQISSLFNDVIGDIAGIVSGAMTAALSIGLSKILSASEQGLDLLIAGLVAAVMIGGKAAGKGFAMTHNNAIVFFMGRIAAFFSSPFKNRKSRNRG